MANARQIDILKKGVDTWNRWRSIELLKTDSAAWNRSRTQQFARIDLSIASLRDAQLSGADLALSNLSGADLRNVDLSSANLQGADLRLADLSGASLRKANLEEVDLSRSVLSDADFTGAVMRSTILGDVDLSHVIGLDSVTHRGPSTIGVDTIYRSHGQISEEFLRSAGLPDAFLVNVKALVGAVRPFEMYSCFISYSSKDQSFTERLHADLRSRGVRCWYAPEDLKIGEKFRVSIDEAIRVYDKLLLVLSEQSISSHWVEFEVESAFAREEKERRLVLFPIRLDQSIIQTDKVWASHIKNTRHVGDFRYWKNHERYVVAFNRLLRDLRANECIPDASVKINPVKLANRRVKTTRRDS